MYKNILRRTKMFFTYLQNNSGGRLINNDEAGVCECVIIEADSAEEASDKLYKIGKAVDNFHDCCPCCGGRWDIDSIYMMMTSTMCLV